MIELYYLSLIYIIVCVLLVLLKHIFYGPDNEEENNKNYSKLE
jgi:hypothetical protein